MATYLKRSSRMTTQVTALKNAGLYETGTLREFICPICRCILMEPVTLPCHHSLCLGCTQETFQHNSLTCPLCRLRVGSFVRQARKSGNLVNGQLWDLIQKRFPKEVEKRTHESNGVESINLRDGQDNAMGYDPGFEPSKRIISAKGEIHREYEIELQKMNEERRRENEKARIASEELIRKLQEEEKRKHLEQMHQDQLLAKSLAKKDCFNKNRDNCYNNFNQQKLTAKLNNVMTNLSPAATVVRPDNYSLVGVPKFSLPMQLKNSLPESSTGIPRPTAVHNAVTKIVTHQTQMNNSNNLRYHIDAAQSSTSKIYGLQSKEELHVPSDILNNKKKKLGVEVCLTTMAQGESERIGSAHSAGSHDSINQEIHHFKPIKIMPRSSLKIIDGRPMDPKLIKSIPIRGKVPLPVLKPPNQSTYMRSFGSSWSAFRRVTPKRQVQQSCSTSCSTSRNNLREVKTKKLTKKKVSQITSLSTTEVTEVVDLEKQNDSSEDENFDSNKNYTKTVNKVDSKIHKQHQHAKSSENKQQVEISKKKKESDRAIKNGLVFKINSEKETDEDINVVDIDSEQSVGFSPPVSAKTTLQAKPPSPFMNEGVLENIAERIKKRNLQKAVNSHPQNSLVNESKVKETKAPAKRKRKHKEQVNKLSKIRIKYDDYSESEDDDDDDDDEEEEEEEVERTPKKLQKVAAQTISPVKNLVTKVSDDEDDEEAIIREQKQIEQQLLQEKKDRELALKLQAEFNAMTQVSGRTRGSRKITDYINANNASGSHRNQSISHRGSQKRKLK